MPSEQDKTDRMQQSDLHNQRGIELADRGWLDESVKEFQKAIELDPESAHAHDNIATVFAEKGELFEALREYLLAIALVPDSATAHHNLACFLATHAQALAIHEYQKVIDYEWDYPDVHLNLGITYAEMGQFSEAIREYKVALELEPSDSVARHELATVLMDLGRYAEAIPHLRDVKKQMPDSIDIHIDLGIAYTIQGFLHEADKAFAKALELDASDLMANYHVAGLRAAQGDQDACIVHLTTALETDPDRVRAWIESDRLFDKVRSNEKLIALLMHP